MWTTAHFHGVAQDPRAAHAAGRLLLRSVASLEELALSGFGLDETLELVAAAAASPASTLKSLYTQSPEVLADGGFASRYDGQPLHTVCLQQLAQVSLPRGALSAKGKMSSQGSFFVDEGPSPVYGRTGVKFFTDSVCLSPLDPGKTNSSLH